MKKYAPLATLVAVVLLGAGLLVVNMISNPANQTAAAPPRPRPPSRPRRASRRPRRPSPPRAAAPAVAEKAYTGRSSGNEVTVAIAVKNGKAVAYACDGKKIEAWLEGTLTGDTLSLSGKTSSLTGTLDDKATFGTITVDGKEWPFSAKGVSVARRAVRGPRCPARGRCAGRLDRRGQRQRHRCATVGERAASPRRRSNPATRVRPRSTAAPSPSPLSTATRR